MAITSDHIEYISGILRFTERQIKINTGHDVTLTLSNTIELSDVHEPNQLMICILEVLGVSLAQLHSEKKVTPIATARAIVAFYLKKHFKTLSLEKIAAMVGLRDHSSVSLAVRKVNDRIECNDEYMMRCLGQAQKVVDDFLQKKLNG